MIAVFLFFCGLAVAPESVGAAAQLMMVAAVTVVVTVGAVGVHFLVAQRPVLGASLLAIAISYPLILLGFPGFWVVQGVLWGIVG
ncbi:MAG: hypothetical protein M2R45_04568 [Verrucomicrobia subdivision 3 bacterium]|nr:hypothetical protein [Limisphaerales bacterium]